MALNLNASMFIPNNPKLAAAALLAPIAINAAINILRGNDVESSCKAAFCISPIGYFPIIINQKGIERLKKPMHSFIETMFCAATYCLYKAMETKSPCFIVPATLLGVLQISLNYKAMKEI